MPDSVWKLFEFCSVGGERDGQKADRHFFTGFGDTNFLPSSTTQICKWKFHQNHHSSLNKPNISLTKSFGYSTVLGFLVFLMFAGNLFIGQLHIWEQGGKLSMRRISHFLMPWKSVLFIDFCWFSRHLTIFFVVPLDSDGLMWYIANDLYVPRQTGFKWQDLLNLRKSPWKPCFHLY